MVIGAEKKKAALRARVTLALLEGLALAGVLAVHFFASNLAFLSGGAIGAMVILGPLFFRWCKEHGPALKAGAGSKS